MMGRPGFGFETVKSGDLPDGLNFNLARARRV
jgi:hypothetical protein